MKKNKKIILVVLFIISIMLVIGNTYIVNAESIKPSDAFSKADTHGNEAYITRTKDAAATILGVVQVVGITTATAMLIILAIKYFRMAPEGKADIKKSMTMYVVGAFILFGASGLLGIFKNAVESSLGTP